MLSIGSTLIEKRIDEVAKAIETAYRFTKCGVRVVMFNRTDLVSDAAEEIGKDADLVVGFKTEGEGGIPKVIFSLRSHTGFDCGAFATEFGGGGHSAAAGFSCFLLDNCTHPYAMLREALVEYAGHS